VPFERLKHLVVISSSSQNLPDVEKSEGSSNTRVARPGRQLSFARLTGLMKTHGLRGIRHLPMYDVLVAVGTLVLGNA
jgi:hypothetical protein